MLNFYDQTNIQNILIKSKLSLKYIILSKKLKYIIKKIHDFLVKKIKKYYREK